MSTRLTTRGCAAITAGGAMLAGSRICCESEAPPPPLGARSSSIFTLERAKDAFLSGYLAPLFVCLGGGIVIGSALYGSYVTDKRAVRARKFVSIVDAILNSSYPLTSRTGRLVAQGDYLISFEPTRAHGWFGVQSPSRRLRGRATVDASRTEGSEDWTVSSLVAEFELAALDAANAKREKIAVDAGYRSAEAVAAAAAAAAAAGQGTGLEGVDLSQEGKIIFHVVPQPQAPRLQ